MLIVHMSPKHYLNGSSVFIYRGTSSATNMLLRYPSCRPSLWELSAEDSQRRASCESPRYQHESWTKALTVEKFLGFFPISDFICQRVWRYEDKQDALLCCGTDGLLTLHLAPAADVCEFQRFLASAKFVVRIDTEMSLLLIPNVFAHYKVTTLYRGPSWMAGATSVSACNVTYGCIHVPECTRLHARGRKKL